MWVVEEYDVDGNLVTIHPGITRAPWSSRKNAVSFLESRGVDSTNGEIDSYIYPPSGDPAVHHAFHNRYSGGSEELQEIIYEGGRWILREISVHQRREQLGLADERAGLQERDMSWAGVDEKLAEEDYHKDY